jgi:hypothetical protein
MQIKIIQKKVKDGEYGYSDHAVKRMRTRNIEVLDIEEAISSGEIIEEYPKNKYSPSCLIYGKTVRGKDLHVQVSLPPKVVIITAYEPDENEWIDSKVRIKEVT